MTMGGIFKRGLHLAEGVHLAEWTVGHVWEALE
jgi:hypothetical protein